MGKARAARREQRQAKRAVAKESRGTKYANQKGGIGKRQRSSVHHASASVSDEAPMAVIRDGTAMWLGAEGPAAPTSAPKHEEALDASDELPTAHKKLRALRKKLRHVAELRERRRRGEELDGAQQALLRGEAALREEVARFETAAGDDVAAAAPETTDPDVGAEDASEGEGEADEPLPVNRLERARALKRRKHLEKLRRKKI